VLNTFSAKNDIAAILSTTALENNVDFIQPASQ
jgi:hypothetical protein